MITTKINVSNETGVAIQDGMIGLFFEDINYAADGGLYAEMLENRSFEFVKATGDGKDFYTEYDGGYGWSVYPSQDQVSMKPVTGSPHTEENPHYMRVSVGAAGAGIANKAYDGISLVKGEKYRVLFWARTPRFDGSFSVKIVKNGVVYGEATMEASKGTDKTPSKFRKYELEFTATESVKKACFTLVLSEAGVVEFDYISMFPMNAVCGVFRKDLYEKLEAIHPGFIRFPGGCIVEGATLDNRYRYKDSLKPEWQRNHNWNRWAVHMNCPENHFVSVYNHYNQTLGLGYYEYFLLCEKLGAKPLPVMNVGFACQFQSDELVAIDSPEFMQCVQDAIDLVEFANGDVDTTWGSIRARMGHPEPFGLTMMGIGNEQWQTEVCDFFERYEIFEREIHAKYPEVKLIGSAGPDVTSERYTMAWDFYHRHEDEESFVYAVDEHYYVRPQWLYDQVTFYDQYDRKVKVFAGEYAAHPEGITDGTKANILEGALAEAAFLTGVERNADVVLLASYAPLFARLGYVQWAPDMIWFDGDSSYGTPSYYVQMMYGNHMGTVTLKTNGEEKEAAKQGIYYGISLNERTGKVILKVVNSNECEAKLELNKTGEYTATVLTGAEKCSVNSLENPTAVSPYGTFGKLEDGIVLPALSFAVVEF